MLFKQGTVTRASFLRTTILLLGISPIAASKPSGGAWVNVVDGPRLAGTMADLEVTQSRRSLLLLKNRIGVEDLLDVVRPEINMADEFWRSMSNASTEDPIPAFAHLDTSIDPEALDAETFLSWLATTSDDSNKLLSVSPDQFAYALTGSSTETTSFEFTSSLGGFITHFSTLGQGKKKPFMATLPHFPIQRAGELKLMDGTPFADFHCALRDKPDGTGLEGAMYIWFPEATPASVIEDTSEHIAVTFSNYVKLAYRDLMYGDLKITG